MSRPTFQQVRTRGIEGATLDVNAAVLSGTNQDGTTFTLGVTESDTTISTETEIIRQNQEAILLELGRIGMLLTLLVGEEVAPSDVDSFLLTNQ